METEIDLRNEVLQLREENDQLRATLKSKEDSHKKLGTAILELERLKIKHRELQENYELLQGIQCTCQMHEQELTEEERDGEPRKRLVAFSGKGAKKEPRTVSPAREKSVPPLVKHWDDGMTQEEKRAHLKEISQCDTSHSENRLSLAEQRLHFQQGTGARPPEYRYSVPYGKKPVVINF